MFSAFFEWLHKRKDPIGFARKIGATVGTDCRLINVSFGSEPYLVTLGDHVSATETQFITHDGGVWVFRDEHPEIDVLAPIRVGNNVFLGARTIVMPGVTIGNNVVIGAGSIVTRDIPDDSVAVGIPAKVISDLGDYREKTLAKAEKTKLMSAEEKRAFFERKFNQAN